MVTKITVDGQTKTVTEWAKDLGVHPNAIYVKLRDCTPEDAIARIQGKTGHPKSDQTPLHKSPPCPKCDSVNTVWNGSGVYKGKRTFYIRCKDCKKASNSGFTALNSQTKSSHA